MKIAFSGSRRAEPDFRQVIRAREHAYHCTGRLSKSLGDVLVGDCPTGVDKHIRDSYKAAKVYEADWNQHGNAAGPIRNQAMIDDADALVAFPCPESKGTWDAIRKAVKKGIPVVIIPIGLPDKPSEYQRDKERANQ